MYDYENNYYFIMLENTYVLMSLGFLLSFSACYLSFGFVDSLYKSIRNSYRKLLFSYAAVTGTGLFVLHVLIYSALDQQIPFNHGISISLVLSYLFSYLVAVSVLHVANKKTLPIKSLMAVALQTGISGFAMFYFYESSITTKPVELSLLASVFAIILCMLVGALGTITLFWLKKYSGPTTYQIKAFFAFILTIGIFATHLGFHVALDDQVTTLITGTTSLHAQNIMVGLIMTFLFMSAFILMIFYDKITVSEDRKFNFVDTVNQKKKVAFDQLTKLPNRFSLNQHLKTATNRSQRSGHSLALVYIDLDHFKPVNDNFGHHVGDLLLIEVAKRFHKALRNCDYIARVGGDEFIAVLDDIEDEEKIVTVTNRILDSIKTSFYIKSHLIDISCSIGVAIYPRDGDIEQLHLNADAAMYKAKEGGKNQLRFYDAEIEQASDELNKLKSEISQGIAKKEFILYFQPKVDTISQTPTGAEALLRWRHPEKGLLNPIYFIEAAEKFGMMDTLNTWVIEDVCATIAEAKAEGIDLDISINLSRQQFRSTDLVEKVTDIIDRHRISPDRITFEITETNAIHNQEQFKKILTQFKAANLKVAIDDFGLHPFSLTYLQDLDISEVKLDRSFITDVATNKASLAIVDAVTKLAHALDLTVVAEGVEHHDQSRVLARTGCDQLQGYYFSRPMPKHELFEIYMRIDESLGRNGSVSALEFQEILKDVKKTDNIY